MERMAGETVWGLVEKRSAWLENALAHVAGNEATTGDHVRQTSSASDK